jgi:hypothetical protein
MYVRYSCFLLIFCTLLLCCHKTEEGFMSDNIAYRPNPFIAAQGVVAVSKSMDGDGSTMPLHVKLLEIRHLATGQPLDSERLKPRDVYTFLDAVTAADTSLEMLNSKIVVAPVRPFEVNAVGGRLELSAATTALDTGSYTIDVEVTNVRGKKILKDACVIQLKPKIHYEVRSTALTTSDPGAETNFLTVAEGLKTNIRHIPDGPNKIIIRFLDKDGRAFNPAAGDIVKRGDRPELASYDPYYKQERTDTALVLEYPKAPQFPVFKLPGYEYASYYRVPYARNSSGRNVNITFSILLNDTGTWIYTFQVPNAAKL